MAGRGTVVTRGRGSDPVRFKRIALRGFVIGFAAFLFLSLLTYSPTVRPGTNLLGAPGRAAASLLMGGFGFSAFLLFSLLLLWGGTVLFSKSRIHPATRSAGIVLATLCTAGFFAMVLDATSWHAQGLWGPGGRCGAGLAYRLRTMTGNPATILITGLGAALGILAATEWHLVAIGREAARGGQAMGRRIGAVLPPLTSSASRSVRAAVTKLKQRFTSDTEEAEAGNPSTAAAIAVAPPPRPPGGEAELDAEIVDLLDDEASAEPVVVEPLDRTSRQPRGEPKAAPRPATKKDLSKKAAGTWRFPPVALLDLPQPADPRDQEAAIRAGSEVLEKAIANFKVEGRVVDWCHGPVVTMYELALGAGVKVNRIHNLAEDLAVALKTRSVRVVAPLPGKDTIGVEVPNRVREEVRLKSLINSEEYARRNANLPLLLGADVAGKPVIEDLASMPHILIAGTTGSGKSVCINSILLSLLLTRAPDQVRLILVDPKQVELSFFAKIPHLLTPVVTDMKKVLGVFEWLVDQMEQRYDLFLTMQVRDIKAYNALGAEAIDARKRELGIGEVDEAEGVGFPPHLPYVVLVVDEFCDLMMVARAEVENQVVRLAQKSRAVGIHIVLATQRPSADVVTGLIKANMPCRASFQVASKIDSRVVLDSNGAEKLLGRGDMLYLPPGTSNLVRSQGTFVSDGEVKRVVKFLSDHSKQEFEPTLERAQAGQMLDEQEKDPLYDDAVRVILSEQRGSASLLQRAFGIGYTRGSRIIDQMRKEGLVGPYKGSKASEVLLTLEEYEKRKGAGSGAG